MRSPSVDGRAVYLAGGAGGIFAVSVADGSLLWKHEATTTEATFAIVDRTLYVYTIDRTALAIDAETGATRWQVDLPGSVMVGTSVARGRLLGGTDSGEILAVGAAALAVATTTPTPTAAAPARPVELVGELKAPGDLNIPTSIAVALDGRIWVVEAGADRFAIFNPDGTFLARWGESGSEPGQFNFRRQGDIPLGGITFAPDGSFYVADYGNFRVQRFDRDRRPMGSWGGFGRGNGQFLGLLAVALDDSGNVYVADELRDDVQVFTTGGRYLRTIGESGRGPGQLDFIGEVRVVGDRVLVADFNNARISVFAVDGTFLEVWTAPEFGRLAGLAVGPDGNFYVTDVDSRNVLQFAPSGDLIAAWPSPGDAIPIATQPLDDGRLLVVEWSSNPPTDHEQVLIYQLP
ncbi:MAG: hypothetical protein FJ038_12520 [Chloroflexi bacterium]|nr:hypothetical protein [Chloroflexota bacterium]